MQITINKSDLLSATSIVSRAVPAKPPIDVLRGIYAKAVKKGELMLCSTDLEMSIQCRADADVITPGETVVTGRIFCELVKKLPPDKPISLTLRDNSLTLTCGKSKHTLQVFHKDEFPEFHTIEEGEKITIPNIQEIAEKTSFAVCTDIGKPFQFFGALFDGPNVVVTDTYRMAILKVGLEAVIKEPFILPVKCMNEVARVAEGEVQMIVSDRGALLETGNVIFRGSVIEGRFPEYNRLIPEKFTTEFTSDKKELVEAIERAELIGSGEHGTNRVSLDIADNKLGISSSNQAGSASEQVDIAMEGEPLKIRFNPRYLLDTLKVCDNPRFRFSGPKGACIVEEGDFRCLILPIG